MRVVILVFTLILLMTINAQAELTKKDIEEIRQIIKEELYHVDKRFEQIDKRFEQIDKRFEQIDKRFDQFMNFIWILATIFIGITGVTISLAIWDRRTMIRPFEDKVMAIEKRIDSNEKAIKELDESKLSNLIAALRELAAVDTRLAGVLKRFNLM